MSIYHQIFHPQSKWNSPNDIQLLESFMYLTKPLEEKIVIGEINQHVKLSSLVPNIPSVEALYFVVAAPRSGADLKSPVNEEKTPIILHDVLVQVPVKLSVQMKTHFFPRKPDTLFWCIYISLHGMKEYDQIGVRYGNIEIEEKQKMMELMKKTPNLIKNANKKITKVLSQEIMSDFMTNTRTTIDMLMIFAIYNNMRIILMNVDEKNQPDKSYLILGSQIYTKTIVIYKRKNNYGLELDYQESVMDETLTSLFCMEQIDKPLKSISNYKIDELEAIAYKLNVDYTTNKLKKQELYNGILLALISVMPTENKK